MQGAFLQRANAAIERLVARMPSDALVEALTAPTDVGAIARLLGRAELAGPAVAEIDPLVPAIARGVEHRQALREEAGGLLSASDAGVLVCSISRQAVDKRRRAGSLLAVREGGDWKYPACQFDEGAGAVVAGLPEVVGGLEGQGPWAVLDFLLAEESALGGRAPMSGAARGRCRFGPPSGARGSRRRLRVTPGRGPSGIAAPPPGDLAARPLPTIALEAGTIVHRVHRIGYDPIFFGPASRGVPAVRVPESRFDSASGRFGVLYLGGTREAAIVETLLRNPRRRLVAASRIAERATSEIVVLRPLALVMLMDAGLQPLGLDNSVATGPYGPCGLWADALWDHPSAPDGLAYRSRHDPSQTCVALFERPEACVAAKGGPVALRDDQAALAAVLGRVRPGDRSGRVGQGGFAARPLASYGCAVFFDRMRALAQPSPGPTEPKPCFGLGRRPERPSAEGEGGAAWTVVLSPGAGAP